MNPNALPLTIANRPPLFWVIILGASILLIALIALVFMAPRINTTEVTVQPLALSGPRGIGTHNGQFILTNGRSIVAYNPISGAVEQKMNDDTLPLISTLLVSPDGSKALLQSVKQTTGDAFGRLLAQQYPAADLEEPYWWLADFQAKTYKPVTLGNGVLVSFRDASWNADGSSFYAITPNGDTGTRVYGFSANGAEQSNFVTLLTLAFIKGEQNSLLTFSESGELTRYQADGASFQSLGASLSAVAFHPSSPDWAYVVRSEADTATGYLLNLKDRSQHQREPVLETIPVWTADGSAVLASAPNASGGTLSVMALAGQRDKTFFRPTNKQDLSVNCAASALTKDTFIGCDEANRLYAVTKPGAHAIGDVQSFAAVTEGDITIEYFPEEAFFLVSGTGDDTPQLRASVYQKLRASGIEPLLADIRFSLQPLQERFGG